MHLQLKIPFFEKYDRLTMINICKQLKQRVYDRGEIVTKIGDKATCMVIVLLGELGVYNEDDVLLNTLQENMGFGERALRIEELQKTTLVA